jgi:hypothetical protein
VVLAAENRPSAAGVGLANRPADSANRQVDLASLAVVDWEEEGDLEEGEDLAPKEAPSEGTNRLRLGVASRPSEG